MGGSAAAGDLAEHWLRGAGASFGLHRDRQHLHKVRQGQRRLAVRGQRAGAGAAVLKGRGIRSAPDSDTTPPKNKK